MKTTFYKTGTAFAATAVFFVSFVPVFAQEYEDFYSGSPSYETIFSGSPSYETVYSGSPSYETVYSGSPSYETVYSGSPSYETVYSGSPSYTYTPGYTYTTDTTYSSSWTGFTPTYTTPTYTTPTYTYTNYTYPTYPTYPVTPVTPVTPITPVVPVTPTIPACTQEAKICPDGSSVGRTGPNCTFAACPVTPVVPVTPIVRCSDGSVPSPVTGCTRTTTIPTVNNTICSDGSYPVNGSCVRTVVAPTVTYQTCWDGSVLPLTSVCPAQYKTCPNGTSIPVNQTCYYSPAPVPYVPPVTIRFNNVVTSVTTEITKSSARCNGIGLIAAGAPSTAWFEYGETHNLGRETAKANIGSSPTAPFSNVLANLKPATTYYCRAVMQNQYGTVKGETVSFTTKSTVVTYVKPVTKTTAKKTATVTPAMKNEIICVDGRVVTTTSSAAASLLNSGQKLITLQIDKASGNLAAGSVVSYKLAFKNISSEPLKDVTIKVTVPPEITFMQASSGTYDPAAHTLTVVIPSLPAGAEGSVGWAGSVANSVVVGKPVAMSGYAEYTVPGTNAKDEVTAYTVGAIVPATDGTADTGAKKVVGATSTERGFLPNSLVEWLALIAIIFIIFILGRSVYVSYKEEKVVH